MLRYTLPVALFLFVMSFAPPVAGQETKDPVCGMSISPSSAARTVEYEGNTYYFCSEGCYSKFVANPEEFAVAEAKPAHEAGEAAGESGLEAVMLKLHDMMLKLSSNILHGELGSARSVAAEMDAAASEIGKYSTDFAGEKSPAFNGYAMQLGKDIRLLEKSADQNAPEALKAFSKVFTTCVSCHNSFRDSESEHHHMHQH